MFSSGGYAVKEGIFSFSIFSSFRSWIPLSSDLCRMEVSDAYNYLGLSGTHTVLGSCRDNQMYAV